MIWLRLPYKFKYLNFMKVRGTGRIQKKLLVLLMGGLALGLHRSLKQYFRIIGEMSEELKNIDKRELEAVIRSLYLSKLVSLKENRDGTATMVLEEGGRRIALKQNIEKMVVKKPASWDGK